MSSQGSGTRLTFVLVTYGGGPLVRECLDRLARHTPGPYRVVIVDSASPDGTGEWLSENLAGEQVTVLRLERNLGFGAGCNLGVRHAGTELVCLLNADVAVTEGWLDPLLALLDRDPRIAAVAPVLRWPDGTVQEAGSLLGRDGYSRGYTGDTGAGAGLWPRPVDYASAACLVLRSSAFHQVGGFCPDYHIAYYEDTDLQFSLRAQGWQVWVQPAAEVEHLRHGTSTTDTAERLSAINRRIFLDRWSTALAGRPDSAGAHLHPHRVHWLREANAAFSALVLAAGPRPRALALATALRRADPSAAVTLLLEDCPSATAAALRADGIEVVLAATATPAWNLARAGLYDLVLACGPDSVARAAELRERQPQAVGVYEADGLPHREQEDRFAEPEQPHRAGFAASAATARRQTLAGARQAAVLLCAGPDEAAWLTAQLGDVDPLVLPDPLADKGIDPLLVRCGLAPAVAQPFHLARP